MDYFMNGEGHGGVAERLLQCNGDPGALRPFLGDDGRTYITINKGGIPTVVPIRNATTTLRKDDWKILDDAIIKVAKPRLKAVGDLRGAGLS